MDFSLEIGETEKHLLEFHFNQTVGDLLIKVDGHPVVKDFRMFSLGLVKTYAFEVPGKEPLSVKIEKRRPLLLAGFRPQKYRVFVNNRLVKSYEGM